jgi:hypothetical protein
MILLVVVGIPAARCDPQEVRKAAPARRAQRGDARSKDRLSCRAVKLLPVTAGILLLALSACSSAGAAEGRPSAAPSALEYSAPPQTPYEKASDLLKAQSRALLAGDEQNWLSPVDPAQPELVARYRTMFESLRALGVAKFSYFAVGLRSAPAAAKVSISATIQYCMSGCALGWATPPPPEVHQLLTVETVGGQQRITSMRIEQPKDALDPMPWEEQDLVVRAGSRVIVAGPRSEEKNFDRVLAVAEQAARLNDRFATIEQNPQKQYRVYLADGKAWRRWFARAGTSSADGYTIRTGGSDSEVVLRMDELVRDQRELTVTVKHEMGHVVTLSGTNTQTASDMWLAEGIAEYIGEYPKPAVQSLRMASVRAVGKRLTTIAQPPLPDSASLRAGDAYYGLSHLAVDCMARTYGERKLFDFVKVSMREGLGYENASRQVFGKPFTTVDKACVGWIRRQVG